ncbi:MAG: flavodoxin family protein [Methylovirgula sp.]
MTKKILLVFYSRTGTTRKVAEALASELKCDTDEILVIGNRTGFWGILRALIEASRRWPAKIEPAKIAPSHYDLVVIGTPVWAWSVASPVHAYLKENAKSLPAVAFFCTLGNKGSESTFAQMRDLVGMPPIAVAAFKVRDVAAGRIASQLSEFTQALKR